MSDTKFPNNMREISQKSTTNLISLFNEIGGKFYCDYKSRTCHHSPSGYITQIKQPDDSVEIARLLLSFECGGAASAVTYYPESEEKEKSVFTPDKIHDYQRKNVGGFVISYSKM
jgi:hypothetical protein